MNPDSERHHLEDELQSLRTRLAQCQQQLRQLHLDTSDPVSLSIQDAHDLAMTRTILESSPAVVFRRKAGDPPALLYVSSNIRQWGYLAEELLSGSIIFKDIIHPDDHERMTAELKHFADQPLDEYSQEYRIRTRSGDTRWVSDKTSIIHDDQGNKLYHQGVVIDITEQKLALIELARSEEKFRRTIESTHQGFLFMDENLVILDTNDAYCRLIGYSREEIIGRTPFDFASTEYRSFLLSHRKQLLSSEYRNFEGAIRHKNGHSVPILVHGNTLRDDAGNKLGNIAFATDLSEQKKALQLAAEIQQSLLPKQSPDLPGFDVAGLSISSKEVGGDYFDFLVSPGCKEHTLGSVIGDIAGHGVDAALLMTSARAFLRMRATRPGDLSDIVYDLNNHLVDDLYGSGRFMTMFSLMIDNRHDRIHWVKAGHDPALLFCPASRTFYELGGHDLPLGVIRDTPFQEHVMDGPLAGQIIILATDGIWESVNVMGEMFGRDRFRQIIRDNGNRSANDILHAVFDAVRTFSEGMTIEDDITLVIIKKL